MPSNTRRRQSRRGDREYPPLEYIAGYAAGVPEVIEPEDGDEFTSFRVGVNVGYSEDDETRWYGVAVNNIDLQDWVQAHIRKGTPVVCEGRSYVRSYRGVDYDNFTAYKVGLVDWFVRGTKRRTRDDTDEDL